MFMRIIASLLFLVLVGRSPGRDNTHSPETLLNSLDAPGHIRQLDRLTIVDPSVSPHIKSVFPTKLPQACE